MAIVQHIGLRPRQSLPFAATPMTWRILARTILEKAHELALLSFGYADNHLHIEIAAERGAAGEFARRLSLSLGRRLPHLRGFERAWIEPVRSGPHLYKLFDYILRQRDHHKLAIDPLREATSLPDLLGLRPRGLFIAQAVKNHLPRVDRRRLLTLYRVPSLEPVDGPLERLVDAGCAVAALEELSGQSPEVCVVRRSIVSIAGTRLASATLADMLQVSARTLRRIRTEAPDPRYDRALRLQLALMAHKESEQRFLEMPFDRPSALFAGCFGSDEAVAAQGQRTSR
jgi:hypothetical protein